MWAKHHFHHEKFAWMTGWPLSMCFTWHTKCALFFFHTGINTNSTNSKPTVNVGIRTSYLIWNQDPFIKNGAVPNFVVGPRDNMLFGMHTAAINTCVIKTPPVYHIFKVCTICVPSLSKPGCLLPRGRVIIFCAAYLRLFIRRRVASIQCKISSTSCCSPWNTPCKMVYRHLRTTTQHEWSHSGCFFFFFFFFIFLFFIF